MTPPSDPAADRPGQEGRGQQVAALRERVEGLLPQTRADLEDLVRIPSVSAAAFDPAHVARSADAVAALLRDAGLEEVEVLRAHRPDGSDGAPAVVGRRAAPAGAPTVLLYAHHDVQPPGPEAEWTTPAFEPTERDGRLHGRGAADDKAGVMTHVTALRALLPGWGPQDGVGVVVFVEGEEESGSPSFADFLATYRGRLQADVIVVADSDNWSVDRPSLTVSLRGLLEVEVEVRTLDHAVHSGIWGGLVPDATMTMVTLLSRLWTAEGDLAVDDLVRTGGGGQVPERPEEDLRADSGVLPEVALVGTGPLLDRLWSRPSATVVGLDVTSVAQASNTLAATCRAKLSVRLAPGQDPAAAYEAVRAHLEASVPWGTRLRLRQLESGQPFSGDVPSPARDAADWALSTAWDGAPVVHQGMGGSIPFVADLVEVFPEADVLVTGVEDPDTRAHGIDESLHLRVLAGACLGETLLLARLAGQV